MLARRKFLAFLGLGASAAIKVASLPLAASPVIRGVDYIGDRYGYASDLIDVQREINLRRNLQLRWADVRRHWTAVEREKARFHEFMTGQQWTPGQIEGMSRHG